MFADKDRSLYATALCHSLIRTYICQISHRFDVI